MVPHLSMSQPSGLRISARNDQPRKIKECTKKQQIQAERSYTDATQDQRPRIRPGRRMNTCRRHLPRLGRNMQKGMRSDQHIFLSIPVQRACRKKAEKTNKVESQAHAHKVYLEYKSQPLGVLLY
ncbi:hypothetical protein V6N13_001884 [Hibiscus sabdariffa]|uniref:Uncharacterized protein n=1 Tax=Hibiscus sabdariffa TaxID=183260 RepID=A0ABR2GA06_9ROSI